MMIRSWLLILCLILPSVALAKRKKEILPPVTISRMKVPPKGGFDVIPSTRVTPGKVIIFGKKYAIEQVCTDEGAQDPKTVRIYKTNNKFVPFVAWCPGQIDGDLNAVTVFGPVLEPITRKVKPEDESSSRISPEQLKEAVQRLIKKSAQ